MVAWLRACLSVWLAVWLAVRLSAYANTRPRRVPGWEQLSGCTDQALHCQSTVSSREGLPCGQQPLHHVQRQRTRKVPAEYKVHHAGLESWHNDALLPPPRHTCCYLVTSRHRRLVCTRNLGHGLACRMHRTHTSTRAGEQASRRADEQPGAFCSLDKMGVWGGSTRGSFCTTLLPT